MTATDQVHDHDHPTVPGPSPARVARPKRQFPAIDVTGVLLDPAAAPCLEPLKWRELFGNDHPTELEIGSGKGLFLAAAGAERPGHNFLGIEIARKYAKLAAERAVKRGVGNVKVWPGDARVFVSRRVPPSSLRAIHVYFPDPWWKKRHKKRRVFTRELVEGIERCLEPAGELHVATDVEEYFGVIRQLVADEPRLFEQPEPEFKKPEHELDYLTNFERKFRIEGRPIFRAAYRKS
jgi:tRNA (guanine-N7-)-methyltransferase